MSDLFAVAGFLLSTSDRVECGYQIMVAVGKVETRRHGRLMQIHLIWILEAREPKQPHFTHRYSYCSTGGHVAETLP